MFFTEESDIIYEIRTSIRTDVQSLSVQQLRNIIPKMMMICYKKHDWTQWKEKGIKL